MTRSAAHDVATVPGSPSARLPFDDELTAGVRAAGLAAGLHAVGIAAATRFDRAHAAIVHRVEAGLSAGMSFTFRKPERSCDPAEALPGARALVVGAYGYQRQRDEAIGVGSAAYGAVARYTWGDRYAPLRAALEEVKGLLRANGWRARVMVDDNGLVDREAAYAAGLGWYGKNANLLLPELGSWFLLGSVVTDAPLRPHPKSERVADGCGTCVRCLPACPTGAIAAPGVIDARRCLSWLLQAPGPIPRELRAAVGTRLYGCDDCQEVCPVNRMADRGHPPPPAERDDEPFVDLAEVLTSDDRALLRRFGRWYLPGRDPRYLRRNALVALGNGLHERGAHGRVPGSAPGAVGALRGALASADPLLRSHAVWAAARAGLAELCAGLGETETDPAVLEELRPVVPR